MQCITRFPLSLGISALTLVKRPGHSRCFGEGLIKDEQKAEIKNRQATKKQEAKDDAYGLLHRDVRRRALGHRGPRCTRVVRDEQFTGCNRWMVLMAPH